MQSLLDLVRSNPRALETMASQFGIGRESAAAVAERVVPLLAQGMKRNAAASGGFESLLGAIARADHGDYLDQPSRLTDPAGVEDGKAILGHVFGSKDVSRQVAANAAKRTGVDYGVVKQMLPMLAAAAMGALSKQSNAAGLGQVRQGATPQSDFLSSVLDSDRDGSISDDLMNLAGRFFR
jgi:hypothetical protein